MFYLVIDSGTTNTRVRLSDGGRILQTATAPTGARTTAAEGNNRSLRRELGRLIREVLQAAEVDLAGVDALIASGMITSNLGLLEVPHLPAPVTPGGLAAGMVTARFDDICNGPIHFIPGVKTLPGTDTGVGAGDILRGEEAEVTGLRSLLRLDGPATFLHYGSHHKAIHTGAAGELLSSETVMTGELLQVVSEHTILASTVLPAREVCLDETAWRLGLETALTDGIGRALFVTRLTQQLLGQTPQQSTNFLLGALTSLDLPMVRRALERGDNLVLYGGNQLPRILHRYLETEGWGARLTLVDQSTAELAAVTGAIAIYGCR
jgi:2-dehydro-3-deoxygalactonokinase